MTVSSTSCLCVCVFVQTVNTAQELRKPVYYGVAAKAIPFDQVTEPWNGTTLFWFSRSNKYVVVYFRLLCGWPQATHRYSTGTCTYNETLWLLHWNKPTSFHTQAAPEVREDSLVSSYNPTSSTVPGKGGLIGIHWRGAHIFEHLCSVAIQVDSLQDSHAHLCSVAIQVDSLQDSHTHF